MDQDREPCGWIARARLTLFSQHAGFVNDKAVGITFDGEKGLAFNSKKSKSVHQPAKAAHKVSFGGHNRKYVATSSIPSPDELRDAHVLTTSSFLQDLQERCQPRRQGWLPPRPSSSRHCPGFRREAIPTPRQARAREEGARQEGCCCFGVNILSMFRVEYL